MSLQKSLGSYPALLITISLTIALFLIGFAGWIAISSNELIKYVKQNIEVQVFLQKNLSPEKKAQIKSDIEKLALVDATESKESIKFISKEEGATIFFENTNENFQEVLGENPFHDGYNIRLRAELINESDLKKIKAKLERISGVFEVDYAKDFLKGVVENVNKIYKLLALVVFIFFIATLLLINNTIKLALFSQRFIIRTMQLVGATDGFIQKPFLLKATLQGLIASIIAILLVLATQQIASKQIEGLGLIQNDTSLFILLILVLFLGPLIGFLSTLQSIVRYQKMDLDKLY
jgi:cell division transport system permease protein